MVNRLAEAALRRACGMDYDVEELPPSLRRAAATIVPSIASRIAYEDGDMIRCRLCGRGPFTRKGFYLHVKRIHMEKLGELAREELEAYIWGSSQHA